jgi:hypothetical protein
MKPILFAALVFAVPAATFAADAESQMNEAGVSAVESHWGAAFTGGDGAYLGQLLDRTARGTRGTRSTQ